MYIYVIQICKIESCIPQMKIKLDSFVEDFFS